jgi:outer membrane protein assembly factor BamB
VAWTFKTGNWVDATPAIARSPDGKDLAVFGSYDGRVYCLDARTGERRWRYATRGNVAASATIVPHENGFDVYVPSDDDMLHAIDGSSGRPIWQVSPGSFLWAYRGMGDTIWESPAAARIGSVDVLIVPFYDGRIHGYRLDRSREWLPQMGDPAYGRAMLGRIGASMLGTLVLALGFMWRDKTKSEV